MRSTQSLPFLALITLLAPPTITQAASTEDRFANTRIEATAVAGSVWMLTGEGGNIGVSAGLDETALVARGVPAQWADWTWGFITAERWVKILNGSLDAVHGG